MQRQALLSHGSLTFIAAADIMSLQAAQPDALWLVKALRTVRIFL
jgi:hypothetical protein